MRDARTRAQRLFDESDTCKLPLPPVGSEKHLIDMLFDVGPLMATGMGPTALSYGELAAWATMTGAYVAPWQARLLRGLSRAYLAELTQAEDPMRPPPWSEEPAADRRKVLSVQIGAALRARAHGGRRVKA